MSLQFVREKFKECAVCAAMPGSPALCRECLERRELMAMRERLERSHGLRKYIRELVTICKSCNGYPNPECKEHGR